jgi:hypothetical protein
MAPDFLGTGAICGPLEGVRGMGTLFGPTIQVLQIAPDLACDLRHTPDVHVTVQSQFTITGPNGECAVAPD